MNIFSLTAKREELRTGYIGMWNLAPGNILVVLYEMHNKTVFLMKIAEYIQIIPTVGC